MSLSELEKTPPPYAGSPSGGTPLPGGRPGRGLHRHVELGDVQHHLFERPSVIVASVLDSSRLVDYLVRYVHGYGVSVHHVTHEGLKPL